MTTTQLALKDESGDLVPQREFGETTPMTLIQQALDKGFTGEQLNGLLEFAKNYKAETAKEAYFKAFKQFKAAVPQIVKNAEIRVGQQVRSRYADLENVCDKLIPALEAVKITHRWKTTSQGDSVTVACLLRHELGHEEEGASLTHGRDTSGAMNAIQGLGSTISYLERYTFLASCGVAVKSMDTDGNVPPNPEDLLSDQQRNDFVSLIEGSGNLEEMRVNFRKAIMAAGVPEAVLNQKGDVIGAAKDKKSAREFSDARQKMIPKFRGAK